LIKSGRSTADSQGERMSTTRAPMPAGREMMAFLAYHDPLTGLANRTALEATLDEAIDAARASGGACALAFADFNEFKRVNDSLGHDLGDDLLCQVADRLRAAVRPGDLVARQGGDEFLVLIRDLPPGDRAAAEAVGQRIADAMQAPFALGAAELLVDVSVGISVFPDDGESPETVRKHADAAMYEAKASGGGVNLFGPATGDPIARLETAARLRRAIEREELEVHYQPVVRLSDRAVIGVEALVRWRDPVRGELVPPADFIPVAERTGVIEPLGDWVLGEVCRHVGEWNAAGMYPHVGVNVSPRQLRRRDVARRFSALARAHGIAPGRLVLEITESAWSLEASRLLPVLGELRAAGFALAIDDFGAGYSSLWRLRELPVQIIKVDRAFLTGVPGDPQATAVYAAILRLADACGCDVVAEGVEEAAHADFLADNGCLIAQGFHFGRPVVAADITALLTEAIADDRRF
jgi:diguanylate cyclase (GGDEF)-like protein